LRDARYFAIVFFFPARVRVDGTIYAAQKKKKKIGNLLKTLERTNKMELVKLQQTCAKSRFKLVLSLGKTVVVWQLANTVSFFPPAFQRFSRIGISSGRQSRYMAFDGELYPACTSPAIFASSFW
jgi:hypothetical protein